MNMTLCELCANNRGAKSSDGFRFLEDCEECGHWRLCRVYHDPSAKSLCFSVIFGVVILLGIMALAYRMGAFSL